MAGGMWMCGGRRAGLNWWVGWGSGNCERKSKLDVLVPTAGVENYPFASGLVKPEGDPVVAILPGHFFDLDIGVGGVGKGVSVLEFNAKFASGGGHGENVVVQRLA